MDGRKKVFYSLCALFLSVLVISAQSSAAQAADMPSKVINIAYASTVPEIDPHNANGATATNLMPTMFESLVDDDRAGNVSPLLAERWEVNEVGDRWRFFLRKGVTFHDGEPFDAKDVKCTFDRLLANRTKLRTSAAYWNSLVNCEVVDDYTIDLIFDSPTPYCLKYAGATTIIPDEAYAKYGDDLWNKQLMYGTGPWMFKEWVAGQYVHLVKNPNYWNKANYDPYYEEMYLRTIMELATGVAAHLAGDVQVNLALGGVNREFMPLYEQAKDRIQRVERNTSSYYYVIFQCGEGSVFHDKNARMAFEYCVDRKSIIDNIYDGDGEMISSIFPPAVFGFDPSLPLYEYNPEKAKEFLKKSSYDGRKITITTGNFVKKPEEGALAIAENMRAVGFNVDIDVVEYSVYLERRSAHKFDLIYSYGNHPGDDVGESLTQRLDIGREGHQFVNEELHELIGQVMRDMNADNRKTYIARISHIMREEAAPFTGIGSANMSWYMDWGVTGIRFTTDGTQRIQYVDYDPALVPKN